MTLSTIRGGGGDAYLHSESGLTLDNVNNTIQGDGLIYNNGTVFNNHAAGVINANSAGRSLATCFSRVWGG